METKTVNIYTFAELSDEAKQAAIYQDQSHSGWFRADEYMASLKALAEHFGSSVVDYELDWGNACGPSSMEFNARAQEDSGLSKTAWAAHLRAKLRELGTYNRRTLKGHGDCKLTGCSTDENAIDGLRWAFYRDGERDLNVLLQAAFDSWIKAAWADWKYDYDPSEKGGYAETAEANDWRYTEEGRITL